MDFQKPSTKPVIIEIKEMPASHDSDQVFFKRGDFKVGSGWKSKESGIIAVRHCPMCYRENYALNEATGTCAFCGYDPNKEVISDEQ